MQGCWGSWEVGLELGTAVGLLVTKPRCQAHWRSAIIQLIGRVHVPVQDFYGNEIDSTRLCCFQAGWLLIDHMQREASSSVFWGRTWILLSSFTSVLRTSPGNGYVGVSKPLMNK